MQDFFGAVDDDFSAGLSYVFDAFKGYFGAAGADAVDAFHACSDKRCGYAIEAGGYGYAAVGAVVFRVQVDFDSADASSFLQLSEIKLWTEQSFCLTENCAYNIRFFNYTFDLKFSMYNVLYRKGL